MTVTTGNGVGGAGTGVLRRRQVGRTRGAGGRLEAREVGRSGEPGEMWQRDVAIRFEDPDARRDDVLGQIGEEQHVAVDETSVGEEGVKVGTWEGSHRPPCAIEVGSDPVLRLGDAFRLLILWKWLLNLRFSEGGTVALRL